ncbi:NmrA/HSCARG family protein [Gemmatimonas sp.]|uniref:NmrA/HSCARG family protein n=1 Tax=Gemmatimonas sp. TaxID=1962908 RepID=UPI00286EB278|nr:NmrA/HSCARG family protein [Gemmatimonas sp.]
MSDKKIIAVFGATGAQGGGLARAIAADSSGGFVARAITRHPHSDKAEALAAEGIQVVAGDIDDASTLGAALEGAYGAFCVTNFWEHFSAEREGVQATNMARATKAAGVQHVIWSTLEDTRKWIPLDDTRMPTLHGHFKCPHFDSKGAVDAVFANEGAPTTYMMVAFYWDNLIHFGMGPRANEQGELVMALPLGGAKLPGIGAEDIGRCAYGIFKEGPSTIGQRIGIAGESLSGEDMAAKLGKAIGRPVHFFDVPFDTYRGLGFPGAEDLGNMFQFQQILGEEFQRYRDAARSRQLYSGLLDFDAWLAKHAATIPIG